jgi:tRNA(Ser,Leu) C12 N-acetylase TAN1
VVSFTRETLADLLKEAVAPLVARMTDGSFYVRLERRGFAGKLSSTSIERTVADHAHAVAAARGVRLRTAFADPDFIIAAEMLADECSVSLLPRALRQRYPFVQAR